MKSIHISKWPSVDKKLVSAKAEEAGKVLMQIISAVRNYKQKKGISLGAELETLYLHTKDAKIKKVLKANLLDLQGVSRAKSILLGKGKGEKAELDPRSDLKVEIWAE